MGNSKALVVLATILSMAAIGLAGPGEGEAALLMPSDDAMAWEFHSNQVTGAYNWHGVGYDYATGYQEHTYFKFDLADYAGQAIVGASLRVYIVDLYNSNFNISLHHVASDAWNEETLTWSNRPAYDSPVLDRKAATVEGGWYEWNLFAESAWSPAADVSDGYLSLLLRCETESGPGSWSAISWSKEQAGSAPYLSIEASVVPLPPSILLFGSGLLGTIFIARRRPRRQDWATSTGRTSAGAAVPGSRPAPRR
ncbi:MAG: DNRLRE domain-containing protein [Thermodesulfobacteriota bacterium]